MPEPDDNYMPDEGPFSFQQDLELVCNVAREAGALAMDWYEKGAACWEKAPNDPVTEADLAVNDLIYKRLLDARPAYGWVSEEGDVSKHCRNRPSVFIVDPIDGTRAFMNHQPHFTICIARLDQDRPVVAAVFNPATDEMFSAISGRGTTLNGAPISAGSKTDLSALRLISRAPTSLRELIWPGATFADPVPNSVAYRICLAAAGRWDGVIAMAPKTDWDLAAASLIIEEAGGACTDHTGNPVLFNHPKFDKRSVVASGASLHGLLIDRLRDLNKTGAATTDAKSATDADAPAESSDRIETELVTTQARSMSNETPKAQEQLLHIVFGGELKDVSGTVFEDLSKIDFVGAYPSYAEAYDAWKAAAQRTVDNAHMRYFILHAHRLLDPETGRTLDV